MFCLFCIAHIGTTHAQIAIVDVDSSESRCEKSGIFTVTISGGTGGTKYALVNPSTETRALQSSNTFNALGAGNYTLMAVDNSGSSDTLLVSIPGSYSAPRYSIDSRKAYCKRNTGRAKIRVQNGRAPFEFRLKSGPTTRSWQQPKVFDSLPSGVYGMEARDSCGFLQNISFTIRDTSVQ